MTASASEPARRRDAPTPPPPPTLSICIATYRRGAFIGQTLRSICAGLPDGVEVLVLDGASPDQTQAEVEAVQRGCERLRYVRAETNSGFDADYDRAVREATGRWCWLLADDDPLLPGAVARVLAALADEDNGDGSDAELLVVNAEVRDASLGVLLHPRMLDLAADRRWGGAEGEPRGDEDRDAAFTAVTGYLSFVGGVVIRRDLWLARSTGEYFGTMFAHLGVIFGHAPLRRVRAIAEPLISIRYGNAMWTGRAFEIWMLKWPDLIWSFDAFSEAARERVTPRRPWASLKRLVLFRGTGSYSRVEYEAHLKPRAAGFLRWRCAAVAAMPGRLANAIGVAYCALGRASSNTVIYDLARSPHATAAARWLNARVNR